MKIEIKRKQQEHEGEILLENERNRLAVKKRDLERKQN